jgi:hypothetical protein
MATLLLLQPAVEQALLLHFNFPMKWVEYSLLAYLSLSFPWNHVEVILSETVFCAS